jgi:hypothetical protein
MSRTRLEPVTLDTLLFVDFLSLFVFMISYNCTIFFRLSVHPSARTNQESLAKFLRTLIFESFTTISHQKQFQ